MDVLITDFLTKNDSPRRLKIAVVGDALLDEYYAVKVNRISPEFPIEVMLSESDEPVSVVPGGAANVCYQMKYWNVDSYLLSVADAKSLDLMSKHNFNTEYCVTVDGWKTPRKKRFYDGDFPIDRWDVELKKEKTDTEEWKIARHRLVTNLCEMLVKVQPDIVIMSDYGKGVYDNYSVSQKIIVYCREKNIPTIVDPKTLDFRYWENCTYLKPNADWVKAFCDKYSECEDFRWGVSPQVAGSHYYVKDKCEDVDCVSWSAELAFVHNKIKRCSIILTDSGNGMGLYSPLTLEKPAFYTSLELSRRRPIIRSVIGAGDCFCAFLAMATAHYFTLEDAMKLAFNGSSAYIEDKHNSPVTPYVFTKWFDPIQAKKVSIEKLLAIKSQLTNRKWVWTNGCFDLTHQGHLKTFEEARKLGDKVVVGLNTDESVKALKGDSRPILNYEQREHQLAHLQCVDFVVPIKGEEDLVQSIEKIKPNTIIKGQEYQNKKLTGTESITKWGGKIVLVEMVPGISTTEILKRCKT
jgi:D-beta-D-heptose 7-phosphate kinase / D-beta-D-heptose 1-phosphate adenosyltransferase